MVQRVVLVCIAVLVLAVPLWFSVGKVPGAHVFADLAPRSGPVLLTVSGDFDRVPGGEMEFDLAMLQALDATSFSTSSIWTDGVHQFTGVSLHLLAAYLGVKDGAILKFKAINDYVVDVPVSDAVAGGPILAYQMDGEAMSIREKGPLWLIYPFDAVPAYKSEIIYTRSIWQLDRIEVTAAGG